MGQFMGHHTGNFITIQQLHQAAGCGDGCVFGITSGGKGIGLGIIDHIDLGHRQTGILRQFAHHRYQFGCGAVIHLPCTAHAQKHGIRIPIGKHIHRRSKQQCDDHALLPANHHADCAKQRGQASQQQTCTHIIHGRHFL